MPDLRGAPALPEQGSDASAIRKPDRCAAEIVREPGPSCGINRPGERAGGKASGVNVERLLCVVVRCAHDWQRTILVLQSAFEN